MTSFKNCVAGLKHMHHKIVKMVEKYKYNPVESMFEIFNMSVQELEEKAVFASYQSDLLLICCIKPPDSKCNATEPWYAYCADLFPVISMLITASVVTGIVHLTNIGSTLWEIIHLSRSQAVPYNMIVLCINVSDLLCAAYFVILVSGHVHYRGTFMLSEMGWVCGYTCLMAYVMSFLFSLFLPTLLIIFSHS